MAKVNSEPASVKAWLAKAFRLFGFEPPKLPHERAKSIPEPEKRGDTCN